MSSESEPKNLGQRNLGRREFLQVSIGYVAATALAGLAGGDLINSYLIRQDANKKEDQIEQKVWELNASEYITPEDRKIKEGEITELVIDYGQLSENYSIATSAAMTESIGAAGIATIRFLMGEEDKKKLF